LAGGWRYADEVRARGRHPSGSRSLSASRRAVAALIGFSAYAIWAGCAGHRTNLDSYDDVVSEATRCDGTERCVLAGGVPGCRCEVAVRASAAEQVDEAADATGCPHVERLACVPLEKLRCEAGRCMGDTVTGP
jgi:hypothetical protein